VIIAVRTLRFHFDFNLFVHFCGNFCENIESKLKRFKLVCLDCGSVFNNDYKLKHERNVHQRKKVKIPHFGALSNRLQHQNQKVLKVLDFEQSEKCNDFTMMYVFLFFFVSVITFWCGNNALIFDYSPSLLSHIVYRYLLVFVLGKYILLIFS
jgi:hypothetical protein